MKKAKLTKLLIMIAIIILLSIAGKIISTTLCEEDNTKNNDILDYDFTDELDEDRVGIGFEWIAKTKTLTITAIKNKSAQIILPDNSIVDIQGNIENIIGTLECKGSLVVRGNDVASLNITGYSFIHNLARVLCSYREDADY